MRVLYFGTYEREYPRNAQVISALRSAGVGVDERHVPVWEGEAHKWRAGIGAASRLAVAELRLVRRPRALFDVLIVGYPGHLDLPAARRVAGARPVVFNPLVSLYDTLVDDRRRFPQRSLRARALAGLDRLAFRAADLVIADTDADAEFFARVAGLPGNRFATCFVGVEERVFRPGWSPDEPFTVFFAGKLIPLHGIETILAAARRASELRFRLVGSGQLEGLLRERPGNVDWLPWVEYEHLPAELHRAGCALGVFGTSAKAARVIPNKVFQALACGTPVITADTAGARELLANEESALLVPPGNADALAAAVRRLANDPSLTGRLAREGHRVYMARASEPVLGRRWLELLERVAA